MIPEMRRKVINTGNGPVMYDVVTMQEYASSPEAYDNATTAILNNNYILPICNTPDQVGIMIGNPISMIHPPVTESEQKRFSTEGMIDMSNPSSLAEVIDANEKMRDREKEILMNVDNLTIPYISKEDTPLMAGLKEAIIAKQCDQDSYAQRFGANYPNEKRLMKDKDISAKKAVVYGNAMDIKISVTFEDAAPDVANPMGKKITKVLTIGGMDDGDTDN